MHRVFLLMWVAITAAQNPYNLDTRSVSFPGKPTYGPLYSPGIGSSSGGYRDDSYEDNVVTPTPSPTPLYRPAQQPSYRKPNQGSISVLSGPRQGPVRGASYAVQNPQIEEEPLEEEKDEPDRLSLLLPQSKFDCVNKQTGYYADEELNCEVFHYCQDNAKHSWICPEGFTFHQVHLICMPPNGDISCKKSSQYHFVNEYLYKPLNLQEAESKPNVTLRYSERYFPGDIFTDEREGEEYQQTPSPRRTLHNSQLYLNQPSQTTLNSIPAIARPTPTPQGIPQYRLPVNQVFRSPEEVNIPLQQRRPQQQQQQQQVLRRFPQVRPDEEDYEK
uniref:Cuticular protein 1-G n=1 Tax=Microplitis mediator TaxID=375433 RepID=A0A650DLJ4_9HYME|nr:cuticular protein 1-G [Microplitis mediator]